MKVYPAHKESGMEWISEIPTNWQEIRFKYLFDEIYRYPTYYGIDYQADGVLEIRGTMLRQGGYIDTTDNPRHISEATSSNFPRTQLQAGDLVMSVRGTMGKIGLVTDGLEGSNITANLMRLSPIRNIMFPKYLVYLLESYYFENVLEYVSDQTTIKTITVPNLVANSFPVPPLPEQRAIANFLDRKTAQIDTLIAKKQRQIELLQEHRAALINQAVTKGLNPDVQMKDSGIEWLGEIPVHWKSAKLKFLGKIRYGLGQPPRELENGVPIIRATNIERGNIVENDMLYVDPTDVPLGRNAFLEENEIIVVRSGAYTADSAIIPSQYAGAVAGYDMVITPTSVHAKLLSYALLSQYVLKNQLYLDRTRAAQPHLNAEELGNTFIVYPPTSTEQSEIAEYLGRQTKTFFETLVRITKQIDLLTEYRSALISAAVTGKIDVRQEGG